jgi:hypothetical protein
MDTAAPESLCHGVQHRSRWISHATFFQQRHEAIALQF